MSTRDLCQTRTELVVIQATSFCNLNCGYCYLPDRGKKSRMHRDVLRSLGRMLFSSDDLADEITVVWHLGEPLTLGIPYYEEAVEIFDEFNHRRRHIRHSFQTNGTLISRAWCEFFTRIHAAVAVSIDGPAVLHNRYRVGLRGQGSFSDVARGIRLLKSYRIPLNALVVVTHASLEYADDIWEVLQDLGFEHIHFNIEQIEGIHVSSSLQEPSVKERVTRFYQRILELRDETAPDVTIRNLDELMDVVRQEQAGVSLSVPSIEATPNMILSFDVEGNVSTFSPGLLSLRNSEYGDFRFGNSTSHSLSDIHKNAHFNRLASEITEGIEYCAAGCDYFRYCGGGDPVNKICESGSAAVAETLHCRLKTQAAVDAITQHLSKSSHIVPLRRGVGP